ncbi:hypothetical protein ACGFNU_43085 [Spirillospora sp. NPDC048911]|uniref:hypothetical protein n=1 Tax=Spirillospora sp. NPDC048911 TaxID=3364527 RepID=UPI00371BC13F
MIKKTMVSAAVLSAGLSLVAVPAAHADDASVQARGTSGSVNTRDSGVPDGSGFFWHDGNGAQPKNKSVIMVRDNRKDGQWVRITLLRIKKPYNQIITTLENKSDKKMNRKYKVVKVKDGTKVRLRVCLTSPEGEKTPSCKSKDFIA